MTDIEQRLNDIEHQLKAIHQRNERVEADKAWEVSSVRIAFICLITYLVAAGVMWVIGSERFWLNALVPTLGFYLSQQSLSLVKRNWIKSHKPGA